MELKSNGEVRCGDSMAYRMDIIFSHMADEVDRCHVARLRIQNRNYYQQYKSYIFKDYDHYSHSCSCSVLSLEADCDCD